MGIRRAVRRAIETGDYEPTLAAASAAEAMRHTQGPYGFKQHEPGQIGPAAGAHAPREAILPAPGTPPQRLVIARFECGLNSLMQPDRFFAAVCVHPFKQPSGSFEQILGFPLAGPLQWIRPCCGVSGRVLRSAPPLV